MIDVLLVDDHALVRAGLRGVIGSAEDMRVVAEVSDGAQALQAIATASPQVVLMDLSMPVLDGVAATREITGRHPGVAVVVLSSFSDAPRVTEALDAGAIGYVLKDTEPAVILEAIRSAARGHSPLDPRVARTLLSARREPGAVPELTEREQQVLRLVGRGLANKQIARALGIREGTVKAHLGSVFQRIGVHDRTSAALWARTNLPPEEDPARSG
ncbi:response regulator [Trujillonella humicola]|uniref:response regulator n=1 Tax=Trujillonella humicola TaxID=3383699 RepID=UPI0039057B4C